MYNIFYIKSIVSNNRDGKGVIMTYNSKRTITSMVAGVILLIAYIIHALGKQPSASESLMPWAKTMLAFIGIGVVSLIIIQIIFHIVFAIGVAVKEQDQSDKDVERIISASMVEDERDKLINLKAAHIGYVVVGIGFVATLAVLAFDGSTILALHILFAAFSLGSLAEGAVSVYHNERGIRNG